MKFNSTSSNGWYLIALQGQNVIFLLQALHFLVALVFNLYKSAILLAPNQKT